MRAQPGVRANESLAAEHRAKPAHEHADLLHRLGGYVVARPQSLDDDVSGDGSTAGGGQDLDESPRLAASDRSLVETFDVEAAEQPDAQLLGRRHVTNPIAGRLQGPCNVSRLRGRPAARRPAKW